MKRFLAALGLALVPAVALADPPKKPAATHCVSGRACLAQARAALGKRNWQEAESWAAHALDWSEPRDAHESLTAYRLAADASVGAGMPRRAAAWSAAGLRYAGPWMKGARKISDSLPAVDARADLEHMHLDLERKRPALASPIAAGYFVQYAGRGMWNEVILQERGPASFEWSVNAYRVGGGLEPVRLRGPAQMSEGNSGTAARAGNLLSLRYDHAMDRVMSRCTASIQFVPGGVRLESRDNCPMGNVGVSPWGEYRRVERWK